LQIISKCIALWYRCVRIVFKNSVSLWHTDPWNLVLSEFTKKQYDKVSVLLEFSTMSLGDWCLKFQEG